MMEVFTHTQTAFRANLTQTDVLESGRDVMDLIKSDLEGMTPSLGYSNGAVNFYANANPNYTPLIQSLVGVSSPTIQRTNVLESFFILSRQNVNGSDCWVGTGYAVVTNSLSGLYSLYRFTTTPPYPIMSRGPEYTFYNNPAFSNSTNNFFSFFAAPTNYSHLMDGVVALTVRAFDTNGVWMNLQNWQNGQVTNKNVEYLPLQFGEGGFYMFSNMLPASVEVEMGVLEDRTLQHAESLLTAADQMNYLSNHVGQVHIFRQRIPIRNVDPTAYQ
jgi:hypothetical protein